MIKRENAKGYLRYCCPKCGLPKWEMVIAEQRPICPECGEWMDEDCVEDCSVMTPEYNEIKELYKYCAKIGINAVLETLYDGYAIRFPNGGDFIQHQRSYGGDLGCVEPAIGCRTDYTAVSLRNAKTLVKYHKDRLNRPKEDA